MIDPVLVNPHEGHQIEYRESHIGDLVYIDKVCVKCGTTLTSLVCSGRDYLRVSQQLREGIPVGEINGHDLRIKFTPKP